VHAPAASASVLPGAVGRPHSVRGQAQESCYRT
jgi:hypothetical protein